MDPARERWSGWLLLAGRTALELWLPSWLMLTVVLSDVGALPWAYAAVYAALWLLMVLALVWAIVLIWRGVDRILEARAQRELRLAMRRLRQERPSEPIVWADVQIEVLEDT